MTYKKFIKNLKDVIKKAEFEREQLKYIVDDVEKLIIDFDSEE